jgi:hypothetical protein
MDDDFVAKEIARDEDLLRFFYPDPWVEWILQQHIANLIRRGDLPAS